jgi:hypothetical protein
LPAASEHTRAALIDARELALILEGIELPTRKLEMKTAAKESRQRALHAIASMNTDGGA